MSPHIELDEEVYAYLKAQAEPFIDTPNTVMRRLLGLDSVDGPVSHPMSSLGRVASGSRSARSDRPRKNKSTKSIAPKRTRAASGSLLPEARYERPLLKSLSDAGGQAAYREVVDAVGRELKDDLMPADFETLSSGSVRWQSRLQFVRLRLIERGYLDKNAPRGVWAITDAGRTALAKGENQ